jgi:ribosomal protein S12 methylthiotransferase
MKYYLESLGCAKNQVDSENIMARLDAKGLERAEEPADADLIVVNSCAFIEAAKQESIDTLLGFRKLFPDKRIVLTGCLAQRYGNDLKKALPEADDIIGNREFDLPTATTAASRPLLSLPGTAYIKISEGCNNFCAFCAIPLIRGPLRSRPVDDVVDECRTLLARGVRELCLVGQDLGSYGNDLGGPLLSALLAKLSKLDGDFWVRLLYIHPDHFPKDLFPLMRADSRLLPYFDIPFQHGSDKILAAMGRQNNAAYYLSLVEEIRRELPTAIIRTTFMVGFPGETWPDFVAIFDFQKKAAPDWAGVFTWSREEGTAAYSMPHRPRKKTAEIRKQMVEEAQEPISGERMLRFVQKPSPLYKALVEEEIDDEDEYMYLGRLYCHAPEVDGCVIIGSAKPLTLGEFATVRVWRAAGFDLNAVAV